MDRRGGRTPISDRYGRRLRSALDTATPATAAVDAAATAAHATGAPPCEEGGPPLRGTVAGNSFGPAVGSAVAAGLGDGLGVPAGLGVAEGEAVALGASVGDAAGSV